MTYDVTGLTCTFLIHRDERKRRLSRAVIKGSDQRPIDIRESADEAFLRYMIEDLYPGIEYVTSGR